MGFSISVNEEQKTIIYRHSGKVDKEEIGKAWEQLLQLKEFTAFKYNLFSDYRNSKFDLYLDDVDLVIDHLSSLKDILNGKKQALLLDQPISTALSMIFEEKVRIAIGFDVHVFSTEKAALAWLTEEFSY